MACFERRGVAFDGELTGYDIGRSRGRLVGLLTSNIHSDRRWYDHPLVCPDSHLLGWYREVRLRDKTASNDCQLDGRKGHNLAFWCRPADTAIRVKLTSRERESCCPNACRLVRPVGRNTLMLQASGWLHSLCGGGRRTATYASAKVQHSFLWCLSFHSHYLPINYSIYPSFHPPIHPSTFPSTQLYVNIHIPWTR